MLWGGISVKSIWWGKFSVGVWPVTLKVFFFFQIYGGKHLGLMGWKAGKELCSWNKKVCIEDGGFWTLERQFILCVCICKSLHIGWGWWTLQNRFCSFFKEIEVSQVLHDMASKGAALTLILSLPHLRQLPPVIPDKVVRSPLTEPWVLTLRFAKTRLILVPN